MQGLVQCFSNFALRQQRAQAFFQQCRNLSTQLHMPAISQHLPSPALPVSSAQHAVRSRTENRKLRKQRRVELGTYKLAAEVTNESPTENNEHEPQEGDIVDTALQRIDSLAGPSISAASTSNTTPSDSKHPRSSKPTRTPDPPTPAPPQTKQPKRERWMIEKDALAQKFGDQGWQPRKRVSPDTLEGLRALHASDPSTYTTPVLAEHFQITPEAIRRILKSKWKPRAEEVEARSRRWERRGLKKWEDMAAQGIKPPQKWREMGAGNPVLERKVAAKREKRALTRGERIEEQWREIAEQAQRLPMEGSWAERDG